MGTRDPKDKDLSSFCQFAIPWISQHRVEAPWRYPNGRLVRPFATYQWTALADLDLPTQHHPWIQNLQKQVQEASDDHDFRYYMEPAIRLIQELGSFTKAVNGPSSVCSG